MWGGGGNVDTADCPHNLTVHTCCNLIAVLSPLHRIKFKQESAALKAELQKFQLESKTGNKGMELATREVDALK